MQRGYYTEPRRELMENKAEANGLVYNFCKLTKDEIELPRGKDDHN
jgi:hypothetical protein